MGAGPVLLEEPPPIVPFDPGGCHPAPFVVILSAVEGSPYRHAVPLTANLSAPMAVILSAPMAVILSAVEGSPARAPDLDGFPSETGMMPADCSEMLRLCSA